MILVGGLSSYAPDSKLAEKNGHMMGCSYYRDYAKILREKGIPAYESTQAPYRSNWDQACGGISDSLAHVLDLLDVENADSYVRVGTLPSPISAANLKELLHQQLGANVRCYPATDKPISRIAVAGGAYGEGYKAALAADADAYVVGEIAHHEILDACARGLTVCDAGHFATEWPGVKALHQRFLADAAAGCWSIQSHLHDKAPYAGAHLAL